ncbi:MULTISPECIES: DUF6428 family protein [Leeuwenhoekiella]|jgi:hypothetical protein|uniref:DUF6428 family protein n=1 Tax=Leeuwenhoekiella TaxID=283735 RepID=UPI000C438718|nr:MULTISPECIES: DUF6428 family protein [Leeuwenhoekiella]MAO44132.1 hypothetical protein [Leeuwenhoekiella sp.]HBT09576.1 hypothetical protein [Leeuwenhoekiella sp.]|tara:strand:- start:893 stop:1351 length:459 start_codon:yes stop_codon:yes gene_type:complete
MKLSDLKSILQKVYKIGFEFPDGKLIPSQYQVVKVGLQTEKMINLDGTIENTQCILVHLSPNPNFNHRRNPNAFLNLIKNAEDLMDLPDAQVQIILWSAATASIYNLEKAEKYFKLLPIKTDSTINPTRITIQTTPLIDAASDPSLPGNSCC